MKELEQKLQLMGLSLTESKIYLGLLKNGQTTVLNLAKILKMNRTTVHVAVESLILKGLINQIRLGNKRNITAEPPEMFKYLLEQEKNQIKVKEDELTNLIIKTQELISPQSKQSKENDVIYYQGVNAIRKLYDEILESKEIRAYADLSLIYKYLPENVFKFQTALKRGIKIWDIVTMNNKINSAIHNFDYFSSFKSKVLPENIRINSMDYLISDGRITIIHSIDEKLSAIVIKNQFLYENAKIIFDLLWQSLK